MNVNRHWCNSPFPDVEANVQMRLGIISDELDTNHLGNSNYATNSHWMMQLRGKLIHRFLLHCSRTSQGQFDPDSLQQTSYSFPARVGYEMTILNSYPDFVIYFSYKHIARYLHTWIHIYILYFKGNIVMWTAFLWLAELEKKFGRKHAWYFCQHYAC